MGELIGITEAVAVLTDVAEKCAVFIAEQAHRQADLVECLALIEKHIRDLASTRTESRFLMSIADEVYTAAGMAARGEADLRSMTDEVKALAPEAANKLLFEGQE